MKEYLEYDIESMIAKAKTDKIDGRERVADQNK
jgi:hypothetical protein